MLRYEWMFWDMGLRQEAWPVGEGAVAPAQAPSRAGL